jgi:RimJ/RimL family protein N-acetyltransferase
MIETPRLRLRAWRETDGPAFAALHSDADVMRDLGGPIDRLASGAKLARYVSAFERCGLCRWAIENRDGRFLGYAGVMPSAQGHPLGTHFDVGWRLTRAAWGCGYATEASRAALVDAFGRVGLEEVLAYTSSDNLRSQAVMGRLGLQRDSSRDFTAIYDNVAWHGLVWVARRDAAPLAFQQCRRVR